MNRSGFALLAVLWLVTALTVLTWAGVSIARLGSETNRNRLLLARAEWAREACGEIIQARFAEDPSVRQLAPVDLGRGTWCRACVEDSLRDLILEGGVRGTPITARATLLIKPVERRLAVLRRVTE